MKKTVPTFYEIQNREQIRTLFLLGPMILLFFIPLFIIYFPFHFLLVRPSFQFTVTEWILLAGISLFMGILQWTWAARYGASAILDALRAVRPDPSDRYHQRFRNTVQEMRLACGLPGVDDYVIPSWTLNSIALIRRDHTPVVAVTEGMISGSPRDELQAAVAHELAHIRSGDSFFIGFISAATCFFLEMANSFSDTTNNAEEDGSPMILYAPILKTTAVVMRLFSCFIGRRREILADAAAVEMTRNPAALARAVLRAHEGYSHIGQSASGLNPLFIVSPESKGIDHRQGFLANLFSTHPTLQKRLEPLLGMARLSVRDIRPAEKTAMKELDPYPEPGSRPGRQKTFWQAENPLAGWSDPAEENELAAHPWFGPASRVRHVSGPCKEAGVTPDALKAGMPAKYVGSFREIFRRRLQKKPFASGDLSCPSCGTALHTGYYEGVQVRYCPQCHGRLVHEDAVGRILSRRELGFSESFKRKAARWKAAHRINPRLRRSARSDYWCPLCARPMTRRIYSYQYFMEIDACLSCGILWFDCNELEILQILIEEAGTKTAGH
ncbi:M48 family metalloprotease [bacterium]|nr:M48 family metalloprotease [bacterium]